MQLILPSIEYKDSYIEAVKEFQVDSDTTHRTQAIKKLSVVELEADFEGYIEKLKSQSRGDNLPEGYVPATTYWLVDEGEFIGSLNIRHRLTERLEKYHGHIGYDVRPSRRGKGYATKMLELALPKAKELGIDRVLVSCLTTNTASRRVIEKNGGIFESEAHDPYEDADLLRFRIDIK
jgi:predicted acetyltransferase